MIQLFGGDSYYQEWNYYHVLRLDHWDGRLFCDLHSFHHRRILPTTQWSILPALSQSLSLLLFVAGWVYGKDKENINEKQVEAFSIQPCILTMLCLVLWHVISAAVGIRTAANSRSTTKKWANSHIHHRFVKPSNWLRTIQGPPQQFDPKFQQVKYHVIYTFCL